MSGQAVAWVRAGAKAKADAAGTLTSSAIGLVNELQEEVRALRSENADLRQRMAEMQMEIERLRAGKRPYTPPKSNGDE
jgi:predicted RNase H-like nuclease (RuvC/YqgF family)